MVLRGIEQKIESLFEGVFGRAFRTNVQPVELARKLAKEMDDHRTVSVSRTYVPNEYTVYLSSADREQFEAYELSLLAELEEYVVEHAKRENYAFLSPPLVKLETDDDLGRGEFGISTRVIQPKRDKPAPAAPVEVLPRRRRDGDLQARRRSAAGRARPPVPEPRDVAVLTWGGKRRRVDKDRATLGRSKECDLQVDDPNVSRRHAELVREGSAYWIVDLDSTNGVELNGKRLRRAKLEEGATFVVGETEIAFSTEPE